MAETETLITRVSSLVDITIDGLHLFPVKL